MTELREAQNQVTIEGILSENKLDYKKTEDGRDYISGDLLIEVTPTNIVPINFFAFKFKKDGNPNKIYVSLEGVYKGYKSIAKHSRENADKVRITGAKIEANEFYNQQGNLVSTFRIRANFVNRVTGEFNPSATFVAETYLQTVMEEMRDDAPTGRLIVKGIIPMYGARISVISFYVDDPKGIEYIQTNYNVGETVKLAGVVNNTTIQVEKVEEMEFGGDLENSYSRIRRELLITKGGKPYEEAGSFPVDLIKKAMIQRDVDLKTASEKASARVNTSVGAGGFNSTEDVPW